MLSIALYLLYADVKKATPDLNFVHTVKRGTHPLSVLLAINSGVNAMVWWAVAQNDALNAGVFVTALMWGTLSLFLGIFLGLIAQGRGMAQD